MRWVQAQSQFLDSAKSEFADGADGWLIAYSLVTDSIVVTQEIPVSEAKNRVPIPNVCQGFNVRFVDTFDMLRALNIKFVKQN